MGLRFATLAMAVCGLLTYTPGLNAGNKLALNVSPSIGWAPAQVVATITVERDAANRQLEVAAESDAFYRSSLITLDGDRAPRMNQITWRDMPVGSYTIVAVLYGSDGQLASARRSVIIERSGGD